MVTDGDEDKSFVAKVVGLEVSEKIKKFRWQPDSENAI